MSVFTKPAEEVKKRVEAQKTRLDSWLLVHFYHRVRENFVTKTRPFGDGNPNMFRRIPEYIFEDGAVYIFEKGGELHGWRGAGLSGWDEYGYPDSYILTPANGNGIETRDDPSKKITVPAKDMVIIRANNSGASPLGIVLPLIERLCLTMRTIDVVTAKKAISVFHTRDAIAEKALAEIAKDLYTTSPVVTSKSDELKNGNINPIDLFGGVSVSIPELWESFRQFETELWEVCGENSVAYEKKERLISDEVNANNVRTAHGIFGIAYESIVKGVEEVNEKFGVKWQMPAPPDFQKDFETPEITESNDEESGDDEHEES